MVKPPTCVSCESEWLEKSKETEGTERIRLDKMRADDLTGLINEVWEYGMRMNDTQRQELALNPDTELRNFIISSSTAPTPLLEHVYNSTMQRVPYEQVRVRVRVLGLGSRPGWGSSKVEGEGEVRVRRAHLPLHHAARTVRAGVPHPPMLHPPITPHPSP